MSFKFCRPTIGATFTALDNIKGEVSCAVSNAAGITVRFVGPADDAAAATVLETAGVYMDMPSTSAAVWTEMSCDPSRTWVRTTSGGGNISAHFYW